MSVKTLAICDEEIVSVDVSEETSMVSLFFRESIVEITRNDAGRFDLNVICRAPIDPPNVVEFAGGLFEQVNEMHEAQFQGLQCADVVNMYYADLYGVSESEFLGDKFLDKEEWDALFGDDRTTYDDFVDDNINV